MTTLPGAAPSRGLLASLAGALAVLFGKRAPAPPAPVQAAPAQPVTAPVTTDVDTLARTLWGEARGEGRAGIEAVACVITTRTRLANEFMRRTGKPKHPLFGDGTIAAACTANPGARYKQFSCWNEDDPNLPKMLAVTEADPLFTVCLAVARRAADNLLIDPTQGATHYFDPRVCTPAWANGATLTCVIGHHRFYKDVP